jgi:hypothetical protein
MDVRRVTHVRWRWRRRARHPGWWPRLRRCTLAGAVAAFSSRLSQAAHTVAHCTATRGGETGASPGADAQARAAKWCSIILNVVSMEHGSCATLLRTPRHCAQPRGGRGQGLGSPGADAQARAAEGQPQHGAQVVLKLVALARLVRVVAHVVRPRRHLRACAARRAAGNCCVSGEACQRDGSGRGAVQRVGFCS